MCTQSPTSARLARQSGSWPAWAGTATDGVALYCRSRSARSRPSGRTPRSLAPKLWSTLPTQFQNRSLLKCSAQARFRLPRRNDGVDIVRVRVVTHDRPRRRIDALGWNPVARERIARPDAVHIPAGLRVVDPDQVARGVHETAEVAVLHRRRRHRAEERRGRAFPVLLADEQEERLVLEDRTIDAEAVLIDVLIGLRRLARVEEERIGGQGLAPHEVVADAVERVRPRLQRHVDDAAGGPAVLRVVRVRGDLELLHRFRRRHVGDVVAALVGVVRRAVEQELVVAVLAAVHRPVGERAVVERAEVDRLGVVVDAGDEHGERHRAARLQRQLGDTRASMTVPRLALLVSSSGDSAETVTSSVTPPTARADVDRGRLIDFEPHAASRVLLKPRELDRHRVRAGAKEGDGVIAVRVRRRGRNFVRIGVGHRDRGARQGALARIRVPGLGPWPGTPVRQRCWPWPASAQHRSGTQTTSFS